MTLAADIFSALDGHGGLSALVSSRIYPITWPKSPTFPLVLYTDVSNPSEQSIDRTIHSHQQRVQFDGFETTFDDAETLAAQMQAAVLAIASNSVTIYEVGQFAGPTITRESDADTEEEAAGLYRVFMEAVIVHSG